MGEPNGRTRNWGDEDDEALPPPTRPTTSWWKRALVWVPGAIGVGIALFGLIQLLPLLPLLVARDDGALGAGPAIFLILFGGAVFGIAMLIRWALGALERRVGA